MNDNPRSPKGWARTTWGRMFPTGAKRAKERRFILRDAFAEAIRQARHKAAEKVRDHEAGHGYEGGPPLDLERLANEIENGK